MGLGEENLFQITRDFLYTKVGLAFLRDASGRVHISYGPLYDLDTLFPFRSGKGFIFTMCENILKFICIYSNL